VWLFRQESDNANAKKERRGSQGGGESTPDIGDVRSSDSGDTHAGEWDCAVVGGRLGWERDNMAGREHNTARSNKRLTGVPLPTRNDTR
jgi:hypothetical protein